MDTKGKVWLVGAGPGDRELLTKKAIDVINFAEVIVYDALISMEILCLLPPEAELINAGKRSSHHLMKQEEINKLLVEKALQGKRVVRLKGGDPFVFGRGGEELELLTKYNIPYEVVPGITSSIAVATYNGIPVTHRDYTSSFHVITGHKKQGEQLNIDFKSLVNIKGTLVFLMGVASFEAICTGLINAGMSPDMPAVILEKGTTCRQRRVLSSISKLKEEADINNIKSPAIIMVGKVCSLADEFAWFEKLPLFGKQIVVTRPENSASKLAMQLKKLGAQVIEFPTIRTVGIENDDNKEHNLAVVKNAIDCIQASDKQDCIAFTSPRGVEHFFDILRLLKKDIRQLLSNKHLTFAVLGSGTKKALAKYGIYAEYMPDVYSAYDLGNVIASNWNKERKAGTVYIFRAMEGSKDINDVFDKENITYKDIAVYRTIYEENSHITDKMYETFENNEIDYVMFTSASTVKGFVNALPNVHFTKINAVCIGAQTAKEASKYGMNILISDKAEIDSMVELVFKQ